MLTDVYKKLVNDLMQIKKHFCSQHHVSLLHPSYTSL